MDKQKQIEEMANCKSCYERFGHCYLKNRKDCSDWKKAVSQYEQGYRKIPEGAVVLTREEYVKCLKDAVYWEEKHCAAVKEWEVEVHNRGLKIFELQKQAEEYNRLLGQYKNLEINYNCVWEDFRRYEIENEILKQNIVVLRKETAEKFAEMAKEEAFTVFMGEPIIRASKIDEICKEITEVKNGRKEESNMARL